MKLNNRPNRILCFIINNFDFIIRFFYCKLRFYKLIRIFFPQLYNSNFESLSSYFQIINEVLQKHGFLIAGKTVLELGPGTSSIIARKFLLCGSKRAILVDKYPRLNSKKQIRSCRAEELNYFKYHNNTDLFYFIDDHSGEWRPELMKFIAGDLCEISFDEKVDFIYSIAVLHHVRDLEQSIKRMNEILNEGGMMYHVVDLKDKFHFFGRPFLFYKYSDYVWDNFLTDKAVTYTNRVRYQDYVNMFTKYGFEIIWQKTISYDIPNFKIHKKFSGRTDLHIGDAHFLLKKR